MMKRYISLLIVILAMASCGKDDSPRSPKGYGNIYYSLFDYEYDDLGNPVMTNSTLNLDKSSAEPVDLEIKFMSGKERDFDVEVRIYLRSEKWFLEKVRAIRHTGMFSTPDSLAVPGLDFLILDEDMNAISPVRSDTVAYYSLVFPKARKETRRLYIQSLNNQDYACPRYAWLSLALTHPGYETEEELKKNTLNHITPDYEVRTTTKSWLRSIIIK